MKENLCLCVDGQVYQQLLCVCEGERDKCCVYADFN